VLGPIAGYMVTIGGCGAPLNEHRENAAFDIPVVQFVYPATV